MNADGAFPLIDEHDHDILMHRDAHFGGNFSLMLEYYAKEGKGVQPEFEVSRIRQLQQIQLQTEGNLSDLLLSEEEKNRVEQAKSQYFTLREIYSHPFSIVHLIADLILTEDVEATKEMDLLIKEKDKALAPLIELLENDSFYDPLFPGYGYTPAYAACCLGKMKAEKAIAPLFHALDKADFFHEETILEALIHMGEPAKYYLVKALSTEPLSNDNENAAIALLSFSKDPEIAKAYLQMLLKPLCRKKILLSTYLILGCEHLLEKDRAPFFTLAEQKDLPSELTQEMEFIVQKWKKAK